MPLQLHLSARAECAYDVNRILANMLDDDTVSDCLLRYEMTTPSTALPDVHFHVTFVAIELARLRSAVGRFIAIAEQQPDAEYFVRTLSFADEFDGTENENGDAAQRILGGELYGKLRPYG